MTERTPTQDPGAPVPVGSASASTGIADQLVALRVAASEVDALAAVTATLFDDGDWDDADPVLVDRVASLLGLLGKVATVLILPSAQSAQR